jgi:hypothetical protein
LRLSANPYAQTIHSIWDHHHCCFHCGRQICERSKALAVLIVESHTGRLGMARLHRHCTDQSLSRYRQTVEWDWSTLSNVSAFKRLHGRIVTLNNAIWGSVPSVVT